MTSSRREFATRSWLALRGLGLARALRGSEDLRRGLLIPVLLLASVLLVLIPMAVGWLYQVEVEGQRRSLAEHVGIQARLLEAIGRHELEVYEGSVERAAAVTLRQLSHAHDGFGDTGEFTLARRQGDHIVFLLRHRHDRLEEPEPVLFSSTLAEPMRRALQGISGSLIGLDYRGQWVLAAHEPVGLFGWAVVAKIDMAEIRQPFVYTFALACGVALLAILVWAVLFVRISHPLIRRLQDSEERTRTIVESAPEGIIIIDAKGVVMSFNTAAERIFGYSARDMIGGKVERLIPSPHRERHDGYLERLVTTGTPRLLGCPTEVDGVRKDGGLVPVEMLLSQFEADGQPMFMGFVRDVSDRKQAQEMASLLSKGVEHTTESVIITDAIGVIEYVNPAFVAITGYSSREAVGNTPRLVKSGEVDPGVYEELWNTILNGKVWTGRMTNRRKDGKTYDVDSTISPVRDASGSITHFVSVQRDVTEQLALEAQLRQAQKLEAVGQLSSGIAHEINTPAQYVSDNVRFLRDAFESLSGLLSGLQDLVSLPEGTPVPPELVEKLRQSAEEEDVEFLIEEIPRAVGESLEGLGRVSAIVRAMKEFAHPGTDDKAVIDLNHAIESTITVARNEWKYVADVETQLDPGLPEVLCFPGELNQVLLNILVNAAHAIGGDDRSDGAEKGTIRIQTRHDEEWVEVRISDDGSGIPPEVQGRIFEPFFTTKEVGKGSGQGLAIAYSVVVDKHGGDLRFETAPGDGTTFIIRLPLGGDA